MNARERFLAVMNLEPVRTMKWEAGYWAGTVRRWYREGLTEAVGLPENWPDGRHVHGGYGAPSSDRAVVDVDVGRALDYDESMQIVSVNNYLYPKFEEKVLEDHDNWLLLRDERGMIVRNFKDRTSLAGYVQGPVTNREDWEKLKAERLQPSLQSRLPANWSELLSSYRKRTFPLAIAGGHGFFGTPRYLFGEVQVLTAYYDDPALMHDIVNDLADFWIALYDQVLDQTDVDLALMWEDMCYKTGPLVSPHMFREFVLPGYKKLTSFFRERGIRIVHVDTDGNAWKLLPLFIEGGVTGLYPFEVNAGMNVTDVRKAFPRFQIMGGLDKTALARGPAAIDAELQAKVPWMLSQGGYIPHVDHGVPPDVSWQDFSYYRRRLNDLVDSVPAS